MHYLAQNLKYLRLKKGLSPSELAHESGIDASSLSAYEENRSTPELKILLKFSEFFSRSLDDLVNMDMQSQDKEIRQDTKGKKLRILPIAVDDQNEELITLVQDKASAGYPNGYHQSEFIGELPKFRMPFSELAENKSYRVFQIEGDSMLPVPSGSYLISEYVQDWELIRNGSCHILVTSDEGIVYKRIEKNLKNNEFILHSDNSDYSSYEIDLNEVLEVWKALGFVSFDLPVSKIRG